MTAKEIKRTLQSEFVRTLRKPFVDAVKACLLYTSDAADEVSPV